MRALLLALMVLLWVRPGLAQNEVNVYNWTDYTVDAQLRAFETQTGIKVVDSTYDTNELLDAKLRLGGWKYDVVAPTAAPFFFSQLQSGLFRKLDRSKLRNWGNLDPAILATLQKHDPGNQYGVPFVWGTIGVAYDVEEVWKRMPGAPVDSLAMLFDPAVVSRFKDCGVSMLDSPTDVLPAALNYLGLDPASRRREDLARAAAAIRAVRPYMRRFDSIEYINALGDGKLCLALSFSGGAFQARERAARAIPPREIVYSLPKEGVQMWVDVFAIPREAPHVDQAHRFIDFMLDPKAALTTTELTGYATANRAAETALAAREVSISPIVYPPAEARTRFYTLGTTTAEETREHTRLWARLARGR
jgi:putrescine transport system substrate-binding protein